ncbi:GSCFA domain-containing protein [Lentibacter sp.]|uniref:GSCFA domain-containing protein n=1 Tax=Lentibacter sp. TaxID=2024994 RepID=UPI003F6991DB
MSNPYEALEPSAFWRSAVAERGPLGLERLWEPKFHIRPDHRIVTTGSCFAQHIGKALAARGYDWFDAEPAPPWLRGEAAARFNYGVFSFRTGNIYTPRMLLQWLKLAFEGGETELWQAEGRWYDPLRPVIEPNGFGSQGELLDARRACLASIRRAVREADVFVFTLGLTEAWRQLETEFEYALCPGTVAGVAFDPGQHRFYNAGFAELRADLEAAIALIGAENRAVKILLTVSPVPLVATASGAHVLTATSQSKALLRAVAGEVVASSEDIDYFPSYEIITHPVFRGMFFAPNMRSVVPEGVATVMTHFFEDQRRVFGAVDLPQKQEPSKKRRVKAGADVKCEEELLNAFAP